jgi:hypothetical protein
MPFVHLLAGVIGLICLSMSAAYAILMLAAVRAWKRHCAPSPCLRSGRVLESALRRLTRRELGWMRTLHRLRPLNSRFVFCTFRLPLVLVGYALSAAEPSFAVVALALLQFAVGARLALHFACRLPGEPPPLADLRLLPLHDVMLGWIWYRSFFAAPSGWRGGEHDTDAKGVVRGLSR